MQCPYCNYIYGGYYDNKEKYIETDDEFDNFYRLPIEMRRKNYYRDEKPIYGCPKCNKLFMGD
jgi:hypothetical protein